MGCSRWQWHCNLLVSGSSCSAPPVLPLTLVSPFAIPAEHCSLFTGFVLCWFSCSRASESARGSTREGTRGLSPERSGRIRGMIPFCGRSSALSSGSAWSRPCSSAHCPSINALGDTFFKTNFIFFKTNEDGKNSTYAKVKDFQLSRCLLSEKVLLIFWSHI